jgi:hypothetical protein
VYDLRALKIVVPSIIFILPSVDASAVAGNAGKLAGESVFGAALICGGPAAGGLRWCAVSEGYGFGAEDDDDWSFFASVCAAAYRGADADGFAVVARAGKFVADKSTALVVALFDFVIARRPLMDDAAGAAKAGKLDDARLAVLPIAGAGRLIATDCANPGVVLEAAPASDPVFGAVAFFCGRSAISFRPVYDAEPGSAGKASSVTWPTDVLGRPTRCNESLDHPIRSLDASCWS